VKIAGDIETLRELNRNYIRSAANVSRG